MLYNLELILETRSDENASNIIDFINYIINNVNYKI